MKKDYFKQDKLAKSRKNKKNTKYNKNSSKNNDFNSLKSFETENCWKLFEAIADEDIKSIVNKVII